MFITLLHQSSEIKKTVPFVSERPSSNRKLFHEAAQYLHNRRVIQETHQISPIKQTSVIQTLTLHLAQHTQKQLQNSISANWSVLTKGRYLQERSGGGIKFCAIKELDLG